MAHNDSARAARIVSWILISVLMLVCATWLLGCYVIFKELVISRQPSDVFMAIAGPTAIAVAIIYRPACDAFGRWREAGPTLRDLQLQHLTIGFEGTAAVFFGTPLLYCLLIVAAKSLNGFGFLINRASANLRELLAPAPDIGIVLLFLIGALLYRLRSSARAFYGITEVAFAIYSGWRLLKPYSSLEPSAFLQQMKGSEVWTGLLTGCIYLSIRGFDNFEQGYEKDKIIKWFTWILSRIRSTARDEFARRRPPWRSL